jgi:hypothetical protein
MPVHVPTWFTFSVLVILTLSSCEQKRDKRSYRTVGSFEALEHLNPPERLQGEFRFSEPTPKVTIARTVTLRDIQGTGDLAINLLAPTSRDEVGNFDTGGFQSQPQAVDIPVSLAILLPNGGVDYVTTKPKKSLSGSCTTNILTLSTSLGAFSDQDCSDKTWQITLTDLVPGINTFTVTGDSTLQSVSDTINITYTPTFIADPLRSEAWHLENIGQSTYSLNGGTPGEDINIDQTHNFDSNYGLGTNIDLFI